eukprot:15337729-Ditylum_brightwellii.AAC.2
MPEKQSTACRSHSEREWKCKATCKVDEKITTNGDELLHDVIKMTANASSIASTMGIATMPQMSVTSPSTIAKDTHAINARKDHANARKQIFTATRPSNVRLEAVIVTPGSTAPPRKTLTYIEANAMGRSKMERKR